MRRSQTNKKPPVPPSNLRMSQFPPVPVVRQMIPRTPPSLRQTLSVLRQKKKKLQAHLKNPEERELNIGGLIEDKGLHTSISLYRSVISDVLSYNTA